MRDSTKKAARDSGSNLCQMLAGLDDIKHTTRKSLSNQMVDSWTKGDLMHECKKFKHCSAPQCPLDRRSLDAKYIYGEPICVWLSEYAKGNHSNLSVAMGGIPIEVIAMAYYWVFGSNGYIRSRLKRAKETPSRLFNLKGAK